MNIRYALKAALAEVLVAVAFFMSSHAEAVMVDIVPIVRNGMLLPDGSVVTGLQPSASISGNEVAFRISIPGEPGGPGEPSGPDDRSVYVLNIETGEIRDPGPLGGRYSLDHGTLATTHKRDESTGGWQSGIYVSSPTGVVTTLASVGDEAPDGRTFRSFGGPGGSVPDLEGNFVVFNAQTEDENGVIRYGAFVADIHTGQLRHIAGSGTEVPGGVIEWTLETALDNGVVTFSGARYGTTGFYAYDLHSERLTVVFDENTSLPNGAAPNNFRGTVSDGKALVNGGEPGALGGGSAMYLRDLGTGEIQLVAEAGEIPGTDVVASNFGRSTLDGSLMTLNAFTDSGTSLVIGTLGDFTEVLSTGDVFDERVVDDVILRELQARDAIDAMRVVFSVTFEDSPGVELFMASITIGEPGTLGLLATGLLALVVVRRRRVSHKI